MATVQREKGGQYTAVWRDANGKRTSLATGELIEERALKRAQSLEAEARFWEDQVAGTWQRMADAGFSPRYVHSIFIAKAHLPFPAFRKLLTEASVTFKAPGSWRDRTRPAGNQPRRRWKLGNEMLTIDELMERTTTEVSKATLRFRLDQGWDAARAISEPTLSRAESGRMGAEATNTKPKKAA